MHAGSRRKATQIFELLFQFKMEEFYRNWLQLQRRQQEVEDEIEPQERQHEVEDEVQRDEQERQHGVEDEVQPEETTNPSNIIYETPELQLVVERGMHRRQKRFRMEDEMFYLKIVPKNYTETPLLMNLLDFLYAGIVYILNEMKKHFKPEEHKIAYLTLFQKPMVNGLNTGLSLKFGKEMY